DGLQRFADRRGRVLLFQPMALDVALNNGLPDGHAVVHKAQVKVARARIVGSRFEVMVGQLDQRVMLAQGYGLRGGRDAGDRPREQSAAARTAASAGRV